MVAHARNGHALIQIIGVHPYGQQAVHEPGDVLCRVVDAAQQHRLVVDGGPAQAQSFDGRCGSGGYFPSMIVVRGDIQRLALGKAAQHVNELVVEKPQRVGNGNARAYAHKIHMRHLGQAGQHFFQHRSGKREGITAGKNDVVNARVLGNVLQRAGKVAQGLLCGMPDNAPAETVAAVHGAAFRGDEQGGAVIFVQHAVALVVLVVAIGVCGGGPHGPGNHKFFGAGKTHAPDGVGGIVLVDKAQIVAWNIDGVNIRDFTQQLFFFRAELGIFLELVYADNVVGEFLFPVKFFPACFMIHDTGLCSCDGVRVVQQRNDTTGAAMQ